MKEKQGIVASFRHAFCGLIHLFRTERNAQIHVAAILVVTTAGIVLGINPFEWLIFLLFFGLVVGLEAINSAIEKLADIVQPERDSRIKVIKDLCAGAVLFTAICAATAGIIIFLPKIMERING